MQQPPLQWKWKQVTDPLALLAVGLVLTKLPHDGRWVAIKVFGLLAMSALMLVWLIVSALRDSKPWR